ncbi:MAG: hypothetical protein MMC33_006984 [Icmadophila ericetorum]|nr:hypothetical protein [Icmadophila ericetorum]
MIRPWESGYRQGEAPGSGDPFGALSTLLESGILVFIAETITMGPRFPGQPKLRLLFEDKGMFFNEIKSGIRSHISTKAYF